MAETNRSARSKVRGVRQLGMIVVPLLADRSRPSALGTPCARRAARPTPPGAECLACHGDKSHDHDASRQNGFALRGWQEVCDFRTCQLRMYRLPRRSGRKRLCRTTSRRRYSAARATPSEAGATCPVAPRKGDCARRCARAPLRDLSRKPRHLSGEGPALSGGAAESSLRLRPVPSRRNSGFAQSLHSPRTIFWRTTPRASTARRC